MESTSDFIASMGVNGNPRYGAPLAQMQYLGIANMRATDYDVGDQANYVAMGKAGIKFDLLTVIAPQNAIDLKSEMGFLDSLAPYAISVEGPNEVNTTAYNYQGLGGIAAVQAFQKDLYTAVKADPNLANAAVLPFSLSVGGSVTGYGDISAYADEKNIHGYASGGVPPTYMLDYANRSVTTVVGKPTVMTETGNYTLADGNSGVTQDVQAKWMVDSYLENSKLGVAKTYVYELQDNNSNDQSAPNSENHYGLFNSDGSPKEAANAIHNLTSILSAPTNGPGVAASELPFTLGNLPQTANDTVFEKTDGTYDIALWNEPRFYDASNGVTSSVAPVNVTMKLGNGATAYNVSVFDVITGRTAIQTYSGVNSVTVSMTTDPLIVEAKAVSVGPAPLPVIPVPVPAPVPTHLPVTPAAIVTIGTGADTLALSVNEDAYQGDAQFTVSVDGNQVAGVQNAIASHAAGDSQTFNVLGTFAAGSHTVSVNFLNDAYAGTADTDRNLYVTGAKIDGTAVASSSLTLLSAGSQTFKFTEAAPAASNSDTLDLHVSEDAYQGDAQFTVTVDGKQAGGAYTATALHASGQTQDVSIAGNWGSGAHTVSVNFLNDAYAGTADTDRNLYVDTMNYDGRTVTSSSTALMSAGPVNFAVPAAGRISIALSEDAYKGDAQYSITLDGKAVVTAGTVTALNSTGKAQTVDIAASLTAGTHDVGISFLNDLYAGTPTTDRNLYVKGISLDGAVVGGSSAALLSTGTDHFQIVVPTGH